MPGSVGAPASCFLRRSAQVRCIGCVGADMRSRLARLALPAAFALLASVATAAPAGAAAPNPVLVRDVMTGMDNLGSLSIPIDPIQDYVQPDTQIEPSI